MRCALLSCLCPILLATACSAQLEIGDPRFGVSAGGGFVAPGSAKLFQVGAHLDETSWALHKDAAAGFLFEGGYTGPSGAGYVMLDGLLGLTDQNRRDSPRKAYPFLLAGYKYLFSNASALNLGAGFDQRLTASDFALRFEVNTDITTQGQANIVFRLGLVAFSTFR